MDHEEPTTQETNTIFAQALTELRDSGTLEVYRVNNLTGLRWDALREQVARLEIARGALLAYNGAEEHNRLSAAIEHLEVAILDLNIYLHLMGQGNE